MQLIRTELKKIWNIKTFIVILGLFLLINIGFYIISPHVSKINWKSEADKTQKFYEGILKEYNDEDKEKSYNQEMVELCNRELKIIDYCKQNNKPYKISSAWSHLNSMSAVYNIILIAIVILGIKTISNEFENNTFKNLLTTSIKRNKLIQSKILTAYIQAVLCIVGFTIFTFIFGLILYGIGQGPFNYDVVGDQVTQHGYFKELLFGYLTLAIKGIFYISISILFNIYIKANKIGTIIPILLIMFNQPIVSLLDKIKIKKVLPFSYLDLNYAMSLKSIFIALIIILIYIAVFNLGSCRIIKNRDF